MKKTILVVSDSQDFQNIIKAVFSETRSVQCASTANIALEILESRPVHLIITSMKFEKKPAVDFISKIRGMEKRISEIPAVILSVSILPELSEAALKYNAEVIKLPAEPIELETEINEIIINNSKNYEKPDKVTGLIKRQYGQEQISELLSDGKKGALMLINVAHYSFASSGINTSSLLACRDALTEVIGKNDVLSVANKNSFLLFVLDLRGKQEILDYSAAIIESFGKKPLQEKVYVSVGLASTDRHGSDFTDLYQQCDLGLNLARNTGKNKACFYSW